MTPTDEDIKALIERLLRRKTINLSDIVVVREYLEEDSILHHETAAAICALTAKLEAAEKRLAEAEARLVYAYQAKYRCNEDANQERRLRMEDEAHRDRLVSALRDARQQIIDRYVERHIQCEEHRTFLVEEASSIPNIKRIDAALSASGPDVVKETARRCVEHNDAT